MVAFKDSLLIVVLLFAFVRDDTSDAVTRGVKPKDLGTGTDPKNQQQEVTFGLDIVSLDMTNNE